MKNRKQSRNKHLQVLVLMLFFTCVLFGQKSNKSFFTPTKIGIQFIQGNEKNFLFDDLDYFYRTNIIKASLYFPVARLKRLTFFLTVQPQLQFIQHQLYNEQFVRPEEENYLEKRERFTELKNLSITAIEFGFKIKQQVLKRFEAFLSINLGFAYIDTETERLARGFTFIENGNLGIGILLTSKVNFEVFSGLGHVSNFDFQQPNSGYNVLNTGIGFIISLQ